MVGVTGPTATMTSWSNRPYVQQSLGAGGRSGAAAFSAAGTSAYSKTHVKGTLLRVLILFLLYVYLHGLGLEFVSRALRGNLGAHVWRGQQQSTPSSALPLRSMPVVEFQDGCQGSHPGNLPKNEGHSRNGFYQLPSA